MADYIAMVNGYKSGTDGELYQPEKGVMDFLNLREEDIENIKNDVHVSVEKIAEEVHVN